MQPDIFVFAGEPSGDLHGEKLLQALYQKNPNLKIMGIGGPKMRAVGMECILPMEKFQVMGFIDVLVALPRLMRQFYEVRRAILKADPKIVVTIDYPGFNLRMAASLRKKGFKGKLCHYICPSVWAWGKNRIDVMADNLDLLLTILPFEKQCFSHTTLDVVYVGNPLIKRIPAMTTAPDNRLIAIFPGSRRKELERNFPIQLQVAKTLIQEYPDLKFGISVSNPQFLLLIEEMVEKAGLKTGQEVELIASDSKEELMKNAFLAIAKSGTVTLELALYGVPTVVTYAISSLDVFLAKYIFRIRLSYYCLVNIIASREIFPELIGPAFTEASLYLHTKKLIANPDLRQTCIEGCKEVRRLLGNNDASDRAAELILTLKLK